MSDTMPTPSAALVNEAAEWLGCKEAVHRGQPLGWCVIHNPLTASAHADHEDMRNLTNTHHSCRPGVDINIDYHPGFEATALAALDAAYADVRAQITGRAQEDQ